MTNRLKHAPNFAVSAFRKRYFVPAISALAAACLQRRELRHAIVQRHALKQAFFLFIVQRAQHAHSIFALQTKTRVHQPVGQLAGARQQQQTFSVQVKPPNGLPFALKQLRQTAKHGGPILWVIMRDHFASGLVIRNNARRWRVYAHAHRFAIDFDAVSKLNPLANVGGFSVHWNTPLQNQLLHLKPWTQTGLRQNLVQFRGFRLRGQNPLWRLDRWIYLVSIKLPCHNFIETGGRSCFKRSWIVQRI
jgi:hypothetical protein